jgi:hypothetical protein
MPNRNLRYGLLLAFIVLLGIARRCDAQKQVAFNGNTFTMTEDGFDTVIIVDPISENTTSKYLKRSVPTAMNGTPIVDVRTLPAKERIRIDGAIVGYVTKALKNMQYLRSLPEGTDIKLNLDKIVIDEKGRLIYYDLGSLDVKPPEETVIWRAYSYDDKKMISGFPVIAPATINGKHVAVRSHLSFKYHIGHIHDRALIY